MDHGCIGASRAPDGLTFDPVAKSQGLLEIKIPYSARAITPEQACLTLPNFFCCLNDGKITLKPNLDYYFQVQGQMGVTDMEWCDFVVWTLLGVSVERIVFDDRMWQNTTGACAGIC